MASSTQGHEFKQTLGDSEEQGSLACYSPWVTKSWTHLSEQQQHSHNIVGRALLHSSGNQ